MLRGGLRPGGVFGQRPAEPPPCAAIKGSIAPPAARSARTAAETWDARPAVAASVVGAAGCLLAGSAPRLPARRARYAAGAVPASTAADSARGQRGLRRVRVLGRGGPAADVGPAAPCDADSDTGQSGPGAAVGRRSCVVPVAGAAGCALLPASSSGKPSRSDLVEVTDPSTYSALAYAPKGAVGKLPLLVVLQGAGRNELSAWDLAEMKGEHGGLAPSLLASGRAPPALADNFAVVAPYAAGKRSFYEEPRKRLIQFVEWVCSAAGREAGCPDVDPRRIFLFGFSDGATVGVELMTTGRFAGGVFAAYGFSGTLPARAAERLKDLPIWVFHSADDVIFPVRCSDQLVNTLRKVSSRDVVRYTRYDKDQEGFTGSVQGHSTGITASRQAEIYQWLLSL